MKRFLLAVIVTLAVGSSGCATFIPDYYSRPYKPEKNPRKSRNHIETFYGTAYQVCADLSHTEFGTELKGLHAHLISRAMVDGEIEDGDRLLAYVEGAGQVYKTSNLGGIVSIQYPAGLGGHTVRFEWVDAAGREKASAETYVSVWGCLPEGSLTR